MDGRYTLEETCPEHADVATVRPDPAKFSPEDHHGEYRRRLKKLERSDTGD